MEKGGEGGGKMKRKKKMEKGEEGGGKKKRKKKKEEVGGKK